MEMQIKVSLTWKDKEEFYFISIEKWNIVSNFSGFQEGPMSKEYTGEQGRYMPPKHGKPKTNEQYEDVHV